MTRAKALHHSLGDKNIIFHREHRSKKGRKFKSFISEYEFNQKIERKNRKFERKDDENDFFLAY